MYTDTPEFLILSLHAITIIATPFHILGTFCILFQTPKTMASVKWVMFNFHCWCMILDWFLTILTVPLLLYPAMGGFPLGILKDFGIRVDVQIYLTVSIISAVCASLILIFENRFYIMFAKESNWKHCRKAFTLFNYTLSITFFLPAVLMSPDQVTALAHLEKTLPQIPFNLYDQPIFILATDYFWVGVPLNILVVIYAVEWYPLLTLLSKRLKSSRRVASLSQSTLKMQRKFMNSIYIQAGFFLINIQIPIMGATVSILTGYHSQTFNNLTFVFLSLNGFASTAVMIYVHKPYRDFCSQLFIRSKPRLSNRSVVSVVINSNQ